jgi:hypothetical protein
MGTVKVEVTEVESGVMLLMYVPWVSGAISRSEHMVRLVDLSNVHRLRC